MPDADDFDVEYFRNLLKGNSPQEANASHAAPTLPTAKKSLKRTAQPTATKGKSAAATGRKKGKKR